MDLVSAAEGSRLRLERPAIPLRRFITVFENPTYATNRSNI
jgi:hypothetical protein